MKLKALLLSLTLLTSMAVDAGVFTRGLIRQEAEKQAIEIVTKEIVKPRFLRTTCKEVQPEPRSGEACSHILHKTSGAERVGVHIPTIITIDKTGQYFINSLDDESSEVSKGERLPLGIIAGRVRARMDIYPEMKVFVRADKDVPYGKVAAMMSFLRTIGVDKIGLVSYINQIAAIVKDHWRYKGAKQGWGCDVHIMQDAQGNVESVNVQSCSVSNKAKLNSFIDSIERAVNKASPLPPAPDKSVFEPEVLFHFRVN